MAQVQTFRIDAGAAFAREIVYLDDDGEPRDLTGFTATLQLRENITDTEPALDLPLTIDVENAVLSFAISAEESSTLTAPRYHYAIELYPPDGETERLLQGSFKVSPEVVR